MRGARATSGRLQPLEIGIVAVEDRSAVGLQPFKDFGFGVGDSCHRVEELEVDRLDRRNNRNVRANQARQRSDFTGVVHTDLEDGIAAFARHPR